MFLRNVVAFMGMVLLALGVTLAPMQAQGRTIIRDAEIESIIRSYATPVFQAAGLNPQAVDIYLIQDRTLNAYVSGGQNIFIHTGLLIRAARPSPTRSLVSNILGVRGQSPRPAQSAGSPPHFGQSPRPAQSVAPDPDLRPVRSPCRHSFAPAVAVRSSRH